MIQLFCAPSGSLPLNLRQMGGVSHGTLVPYRFARAQQAR